MIFRLLIKKNKKKNKKKQKQKQNIVDSGKVKNRKHSSSTL
jgi:hypothetical protein